MSFVTPRFQRVNHHIRMAFLLRQLWMEIRTPLFLVENLLI
nr:MAG TPA_asm: hypothetical protein [Caudoviricetes sp.]